MSSVTIKDVAREAAVSVGTVSKYLNGIPCSAARETRIRETISRLKYKRNPFARSTRTAKSYSIGLVLEEHVKKDDNLWVEGWLTSLLYALSRTGYRGTVFLVDSTREDFSPEIFDGVVDGLITFGLFYEPFWKKMQLHCTLPLVTYLEQVPYEYGFCFPVEMKQAMTDLAQEFYNAGHRHIAVIGQPEKTAFQKSGTFIEAFENLGSKQQKAELLVTDHITNQIEQGYLLTQKALQEHEDITGIFYMSDNLACRGLCALMEQRKVIGQDISVASYDHTVWAENFHPALTGVGLGHETMAAALVDYLCSILSGDREKVSALQKESFTLKYFPGKSIKNI